MAFLSEENDGIQGGITYHSGRINTFAERKMLGQEQMGRNWKINVGKNLEFEEKPSITSLLISEIFYKGRRDKLELEIAQAEVGKRRKENKDAEDVKSNACRENMI